MIERVRFIALKHKTPTNIKKLYFFHGRTVSEQLLAKYFQDKGYAIVRPEMLSLKDQLNLLINCESFASTIGSCAHNMIFTRNNTEVILLPRTFFRNGYQAALDDLHEKNIFYIDSNLSTFAPAHSGPFCYIISQQLKDFFCDSSSEKYDEESILHFLNYVNISIRSGLRENPDSKEYYSKTMADFLSKIKHREDLTKRFGIKMV